MKKESKIVDKSESLVLFTKNQFVRQFQKVMNDDESLTLKFQMINVATVFKNCLNRLNCEWSDFVDVKLNMLQKDL